MNVNSKFWGGDGESSGTSSSSASKSKASDPNSQPPTSDSSGSRPPSSTVAFATQYDFTEIKEHLERIPEENIVKPPLVLLSEQVATGFNDVKSEFKNVNERIDVGFNKMEGRLAQICGEHEDNISVALEKHVIWLLEKEHGRKFQRSFYLECIDGTIEEIDVFSEPPAEGEPPILAECTLSLLDLGKFLKCVTKRNEVAMKYDLPTQKVICYLYAMRIDKENESLFVDGAKEAGIELRILCQQK